MKNVYELDVAICSEDQQPISKEKADEFFDAYIELVESKGLSTGGSFGPCEEEETLTVVDRAEEYALEMHGDQMYGEHPYEKHLKEVTGSIYIFDKSDYKIEHIVIGWLHDVIEDTDATKEDIINLFGNSIADAVEALTYDGGLLHDYLAKIKCNPSASYVKIHDRFVNMSNSVGHPKLAFKYISQYEAFKGALYQSYHKNIWKLLDKVYDDLVTYVRKHNGVGDGAI